MATVSEGVEIPNPGELVLVRSRRWLVEEVVPPTQELPVNRVRLACADDDHQGAQLEVFWEYELDRQILRKENWDDLGERGFDPPRLFSAFLNTLRWNCVTATEPGLFQAPFRAGIKIEPYQMEPLRKALRLPRVNLFIADDTGLGKTIEAGLIARELLLRKKAKNVVVSAPPSVLEQWRMELEERFGLIFEVLDRNYFAKVRRERGFGVNPFSTHSRFLISHKLLIDENYAQPLRDWLGEFMPGSLLILDEAHHAAPSSGQKYGIESKFTRAIRDLSARFEHRLFLSATPHNGHSNSFSTLLEILDPHRFTRGVKVQGRKNLDDVMVRRLKEDIRSVQGGFPVRKIERIEISGLPESTPELVLSNLLNEYRTLFEKAHAGSSKRAQAAAGLLVVGLQQKLLSSIEAFARGLETHRQSLERRWKEGTTSVGTSEASLPQLVSDNADDESARWSDEELEAAQQADTEKLSESLDVVDDQLRQQQKELLGKMRQVAEDARYQPDEKMKRLIEWIRENMCPDLPEYGQNLKRGQDAPLWNRRRLLIFTENVVGTKRRLQEVLEHAIRDSDQASDRIAVIQGATSRDGRKEIQRQFNADPDQSPLRILIATDAAREGLNFQAHCSDLFHFDLPWNPGRLEQRNGRIDRKLQPQDEVRCHYFAIPQRVEDRVLEVLVKKTEVIRRELGSLSQVIDQSIEERLKGGIRHADAAAIQEEIESADLDADRKAATEEELEAVREREEDLQKQIDECTKILNKSRDWVQFQAGPFREALSCSLELSKVAPLEEGIDEDGQVVWRIPQPDRLAQTDLSWQASLDTLRSPRKPQQKLQDWRRDAPIRPLIFEDAGVLTDEKVHLHLEQRVAHRLLSRFSSQGLMHHDLSRACVAQTTDGVARVVLLGRLSLYGQGAERLHEEIIPIAARWIEPSKRNGPLKAYGRTAESDTMSLLDTSLMQSAEAGVPEPQQQAYLETAAQDVVDLLQQLQPRADEEAEKAIDKLRKRGELEARQLSEIIDRQRNRVRKELEKFDLQGEEREQLILSIAEVAEEKKQLEANVRSWRRQLEQFDLDIDAEPQRIRDFYEVKARRVEPIGLIYLWPGEG